MVFGSLPRMKWTYVDPAKKMFLFDGERSFFYVAEDEQLTVTTLTDEQRKALPFLVLSDPAAVEKGYAITRKSSARATTVTLTARDTSVAVPRISVVRLPAGSLESIEYADRDGNTTRFEFSGYAKVTIDANTFRFDAPPGTQVVEQ